MDVLPDDVLLEIFDFYMINNPSYESKRTAEAWQSLVHVCRRWRNIVFGSPRRLNLQLYCTPETPVKDRLDIWPALPLIIAGNMTLSGTDNVITALGKSDRLREVLLSGLAGWGLDKVLAVMQVPLLELTSLRLFLDRSATADGGTVPVVPIPDLFLGGSASRLRSFELSGIPFPGFPKVLLSAINLVHLRLFDIPTHSGYISPQAMIAFLSALSNLESFQLRFRFTEYPDLHDGESRRPPPSKRSTLPSLKRIHFQGASGYLEELVADVDAPRLDCLRITFFDGIDLDSGCPRLAQFLNCAPTLRELDEAHVQFHDDTANVTLRSRTSKSGFDDLRINIWCNEPDWQLLFIREVWNSSLRHISTVEDLFLKHEYLELVWDGNTTEAFHWLELLRRFTAVKNLYLSEEITPCIATALRFQQLDDGEKMTELLPSLRNIFVKDLEPSDELECFGRYVSAALGRPISISVWDRS